MKRLFNLLAVSALCLALGSVTFAGDIHTPGPNGAEPGDIHTPGPNDAEPGDIHTPGPNAESAGDIHTPGPTALALTMLRIMGIL